MSEKAAIHSKKPLTEILSNVNFILGMISIIVFVLALFFKSTPIHGQSGSFFLDEILVSTLCLVGNVISTVIIVVVSIMNQKNFMRYHFRAIFGFFLALLPILITLIAGK